MPITHGYCTLDQLKSRLSVTDTVDDTTMELVIQGVSRSIDAMTGRRFWATTADETRYYTAKFDDMLFVDDLQSITTLKTDEDSDRTFENTWTTADYDLLPWNASLDGQPYTRIEVTPLGNYEFPAGARKGVEITGVFGFCTDENHPDVVREACLIQSSRIFKRKDAPFGVVGSPEMGQLQPLQKLDPDVVNLLDSVRRLI